ncbi:MAG: hypothetical protein FWB78_03125 [Treponema sp.]|nr:hypothetical protein [Treponema sp.]
MKHVMFFFLLMAVVLGVLSGCRDNRRSGNVVLTTPRAETMIENRAEVTAEAPADVVAVIGTAGQIRTGLGVVSSVSASRSATGNNDGLAQVDSTLVAITLDENGVITRASFDAAQTRVGFNAQGQITTDLAAPVRTKVELGNAYGMHRVSGIGREYHEQAAALETWAIGRTPARFLSMALNGGRPAEADLTASVTVNVSGFLTAMELAADNTRGGYAYGNHRTGLGVVTEVDASRNAAANQAGRARVTSYYAVLTLNERGVIIAAWIDSTQFDVEFDATGTLLPLPTALPTRYEMGDAYGLRRASHIGREWNEQMREFTRWMVGKTPTEVVGMSLNEGHPAGADLTASVTINVLPVLAAVSRAAENAR